LEIVRERSLEPFACFRQDSQFYYHTKIYLS
jgi:hypothetical protein